MSDSEDSSSIQEINEPIHFCEQCSTNKSKYKCPGCKRRHCSIACINIHKKELDCKGVNKVEKYISKANFTEKDLKQDLKFLQNQINNTEKIKKKLSLIKVKTGEKNMRAKLLKEHAYKKHNIQLQILPFIYERHRNNLSFYYTKDKTIYWCVELLFYSQEKLFSIITQPISELTNLKEIVSKNGQVNTEYLLKFGIDLNNSIQIESEIDTGNYFLFIKNIYQDQDPLLECLKIQWEFNLEKCLKNTKFIELPTFYVVRKDDLEQFSTQYKQNEYI